MTFTVVPAELAVMPSRLFVLTLSLKATLMVWVVVATNSPGPPLLSTST